MIKSTCDFDRVCALVDKKLFYKNFVLPLWWNSIPLSKPPFVLNPDDLGQKFCSTCLIEIALTTTHFTFAPKIGIKCTLQKTTKSWLGSERRRAFVTSWCQGQCSSISSLAFWRESFYTLLFCHFLSPSPIDFYGRNFLLSLLRPLHIVFFIKKPIFHKNKSPFHSVKEASVFSSVYDSKNARQ